MDFFEILKVIFLGIVEGLTEWLPISSTGHMILVDEFIKLKVTPEFMEMFLVVIQLGAILAVILLFWKKIFPFGMKKTDADKSMPYVKMDIMDLWFKVLVAVIPAAVIGIPLDDAINKKFYNFGTVSITLIVYGILFIVIENWKKGSRPKINRLSEITYKTALIIGIFQVLALIPGTSRSGATIVGAMMIGVSRYVAAEFTFFLAVPVMFGASLIKVVKFGFDFSGSEAAVMVVGMAVAFIVSVAAIKFLMGYIKKHSFKVFGYYRIVLGIILIAYASFGI